MLRRAICLCIALYICLLGTGVAAAQTAADAISKASAFTAALKQGAYAEAEAMFAPAVQQVFPVEQLQATWVALPTQLGELQRIEAPYEAAGTSRYTVRQPLHYALMDMDLLFGFNAELQVEQFLLVNHLPRPSDEESATVPPYVDKSKFTEQPVTVGEPGYPLQGMLTMPAGPGPFPVVVLVQGSGPNDKDETLGPNKPFRDLAWGLASQGVAVLRYDKRTLTYGPTMTNADITLDNEVVTDAVLAARLLEASGAFSSVFVLGHSLGGTMAPYIAQQLPNLTGVIIAAGTTRPLYELVLEQTHYLVQLDGVVTPDEEAAVTATATEVALISSGKVQPTDFLMGAPGAYWLDVRSRNPLQIARTLPQPILFLQGERDYQVTIKDFNLWQNGLAGKQNIVFKTYASLNHLFMSGSGAPNPTEYYTPSHVDAQVIANIANWIKAQ